MARSIDLVLSRLGAPPVQGSVGFVNNAIAPALERHGWEVRSFQPPPGADIRQAMLPLGLAALEANFSGSGPADLALHDDAGLAMRIPSRRWAKKNVILYHGLLHGAATWMANPDIDLHCANSEYLARVVRLLLAFPDWRTRRCLDPRAFGIVTDVRLPLPCVADPEGSMDFGGADLSAELLRQIDSGVIFGHALQPHKQDWTATLSILFCLNELARSHGTPPVKLAVADASLDSRRREAYDAFLAAHGYRCDDLFFALPPLNQRALFRLMRACRFGLAYNHFPEPFGFYLLESVHNGCPVFTNGAGNNRFLLPPDHGIVVHETLAMVGTSQGEPEISAFESAARLIHSSLMRADELKAECRRGAEVIVQTGTMAAFEASLTVALDRLERPGEASPDFEQLRVALSPLVRTLDFASGRSLNDYGSGVLDPSALSAAHRLLDQRCADLDSNEMERLESEHGLFRRGILTLLPAT